MGRAKWRVFRVFGADFYRVQGDMKKKSQRRSARRASGAKSGRRVVFRETVQKIERPVSPLPKDMMEARKNISDLVRGSAVDIVDGLIEKAAQGEVAPARFLFEMVGIYPATEETTSKPEDSLAYTLLQRMGLPPDLDAPGQPPTGNER
jgi:hypothetical protein